MGGFRIFGERAAGSSAELPAGTVTFMFTDIEGSTNLLRRLGSEGYSEELSRHHERIRQAVAEHGAREMGTEGDAFFIVFPRASDAVAAAAEVQSTFAGGPVRVRIGIHTGEPLLVGHGYVGIDIHKAARICTAAHGGQVVISKATRELVGGELRDLGEYELKDFPVPERLFQVGSGTFPPLRASMAMNLPAEPDRLVGRDAEVATLRRSIEDPHIRLLTLVGPGGVGKTRLALAVAHAVHSSFSDGAWWVELAGVGRPDDVAATIARTLGVVRVPGETTRAAVLRHLARRQLLLVIDNFEHVLEAADLIVELLAASKELTVLATSREALDVGVERRIAVPPLALPATGEEASVAEVESAPATALFIEAARRRQKDFSITPAAAPRVAQICARLDGLPLALELAAARVDILSIGELAARMETLADLGAGPRDAPARQRTLTAAIDWSYELLDEQQRSAFTRFAVFAGGATVDAAGMVTGATIDTLQALLAKSLLTRRTAADGATRLAMLETVRQYALERLGRDPEWSMVARQHFDVYLRLVEETIPKFSTHDEEEALATVDREVDNIRAALRWALEQHPAGALRLAGLLGEYWWIRSNTDGSPWLDAALEAAGRNAPAEDRARAHLARSYQLRLRRQPDAALREAERALALSHEAHDDYGISESCSWLCPLTGWRGDKSGSRAFVERAYEHARMAGNDGLLAKALARRISFLPPNERAAALDQAVALLESRGDYRHLQIAYNNCGDAALKEDRVDEALALFEKAWSAAQQQSSPWLTVRLLGNIGMANLFAGDYARASDAAAHLLDLCQLHDIHSLSDWGIAGIAALAAIHREPDRAARLIGFARKVGDATADDRPVEDRLERDYLSPAREEYGPKAWREHEQEGARLAFNEAIDYARETIILLSAQAASNVGT